MVPPRWFGGSCAGCHSGDACTMVPSSGRGQLRPDERITYELSVIEPEGFAADSMRWRSVRRQPHSNFRRRSGSSTTSLAS
eukprot:125959-Pyramimonas_sp.AAC.1